ncbi:MAG: succinylglutamate desuccinylase/aspartoacylase family protein [Betaproteobacteria bacterium]
MKTIHHPLVPTGPGASLELVSLHYGTPGSGPKAALQASLHADEIPAMLVAHRLRRRLDALDAQGSVRGEIVLVPAANPIGLGQRLLHGPQGRFDLASGENFNRHYANLVDAVAQRVQGRVGADAAHNVRVVRDALREAAAALPARSTLESLRKVLLRLAIDADVVLDLHSDQEGVLHLYTTPASWPRVEPLARTLGVRVALLAETSGDDPFDEACSMVWPLLAQRLGPAVPLPAAGVAATVELRGESDVSNELAQHDAQAILHYLATQGFIDEPQPELPPALCEATPLSGSMSVVAPFGGIVVYLREPGDAVRAGDPIAQLIDPIADRLQVLKSPVDGVFYARELRRFTPAGGSICKIAGREPRRQGKLLSD